MRVSSPGIAAAFIDGVRMQGTDVVDYGMLGDRHAVLRGRTRRSRAAARRSRRRTTRRQYNGVKMVRAGALPLSGDAGIGDIRDMIANDRAAAARGTRAARSPRATSSPNTSRR